jgi:DNA repair protein RecN (Recombination protein N)
MLIIEHLELLFQPGLNVLTGETGAGKSILLDSLGFVLGWRGRAELVRAGAEQGEVTAEFDLAQDHPAWAILDDAGIPADEELILRRVNTRDGRKTAFVNDRRVSGELLRRISETLIELHGQHDDRGLLNARGHRRLLDDFGQLEDCVADVRSAWKLVGEADAALHAAREKLTGLQAEEDFLRHSAAEISHLAPEPGEDATLDARRRLMQAAGRIGEDIARARQALGLEGAEGNLTDATRWLDGAADKAEGALDGALQSLARALSELGEAQDGVDRALDLLSFDPGELERTEERLFAIRALSRKHGVAADELAAFGAALDVRLADLETGTGHIAELEQRLQAAKSDFSAKAKILTGKRKDAAARLDKAMAAELAPLKLERAIFKTEVGDDKAGPEGADAVSFTVVTTPGAPPGPLTRIASGGELSRFLLALKVCLTSQSGGVTMIFDEIDRGVGGATADAVGRRLSSLSENGQVLVVTHSPQVAALARHHWRVEKRISGGATSSAVEPLGPDARIDEIARMLAGDTVTEEARGAAKVLLAG